MTLYALFLLSSVFTLPTPPPTPVLFLFFTLNTLDFYLVLSYYTSEKVLSFYKDNIFMQCSSVLVVLLSECRSVPSMYLCSYDNMISKTETLRLY